MELYVRPLLIALLAALALVLPSSPALAQFPSGDPRLEALLQEALEKNPEVLAQKSRVLAAEERPSQSRALPDPRAELEVTGIAIPHPSLSDALSENLSLGLFQDLPGPGKRRLASQKAQREIEVEQARLSAVRSSLRAEVLSSVCRYWTLMRRLEVNERMHSALAGAAEGATAAYAAGKGSQADVLMAQSLATGTLLEREELAHGRDVVLSRLASLLARPVRDEEIDGVEVPEPATLPAMEALERASRSASPAVHTAAAEATAAAAGVELARIAGNPDFSIGARYRYRDMSMGGGDYITLEAGMTLPFFHRKSRYRPAIQEALYMRDSALEAKEAAANASVASLSEAYHEALTAGRLYDLYKNGLIMQADQAYRSALVAYGVGQVDLTTLASALGTLYQYQDKAISARSAHWIARFQMEALVGGRLPGEGNAAPARPPSE